MQEAVKRQNLLFLWLAWHFVDGPKNILLAWKNFLLFGLNYFSIGLLLRTLFSPWRKYSVSYGKGFDLGRYSSAFFSNLVFRLLGFLVRIVFIIIGLCAELFIVLAGFVLLLAWIFLPLLIILGIYHGFRIFF